MTTTKDYKSAVEKIDAVLTLQEEQRKTLMRLRRALIGEAEKSGQRLWALERQLADMDDKLKMTRPDHRTLNEARYLRNEIRRLKNGAADTGS